MIKRHMSSHVHTQVHVRNGQRPMVTRYDRLRDGVRATDAEVAEDDYKHEDKTSTLSRLGQASTRDSIGVRHFSGSTPKVHLPYPA